MKEKLHRKKKHTAGKVIVVIVCALFAFLFIMPTVLTITNSFMEQSEINSNYGKIFQNFTGGSKTYISDKVTLKFIPDKVSLSQYITALIKSPDYLFKFWNSVILVVPIVIFQVATAALAAYGFTRWRSKFRSFMFFFYVILMLMPYQVTLVPNYLVSDWFGILNTRWAIIFPGMFAPFSVFLLTKFMRRIPVSLIEAAKLDGAGEWQIFTRICLPQCRSALYSIAMLVFIDYWNMVEQPIILLPDADKQPLSVYLSTINAGEVLGVAGVAGSGQRELLESIAGLYPISSGSVTFYPPEGGAPEELAGKDPMDIRKSGIAMSFVPEDRLGMGLVGSMGMTGNMMLRSWRKGKSIFLDRKDPEALAQRIWQELEVVTPSTAFPVRRMSGGNVQKVLVGREIAQQPAVLMTAYAVRGLDINTSYTIYNLLTEQKMKGVAVVYVGEDLDVLLELCDRIVVLCGGQVSGVVDGRKTNKLEVGALMTRVEGGKADA